MGTTSRNMSWKYGDCKPVLSQAKQALVTIGKGDLVAQASGTITGATSGVSITVGLPYPASDEPWDTNLATTQETFVDKFLGCAAQRGLSAETDPLRINTRGVHEFDCASAAFALGALVGPAKQSGNLLEDQKVVAVATVDLAIGRVAKAEPAAVTKVLVEVFSSVMEGGVQAIP